MVSKWRETEQKGLHLPLRRLAHHSDMEGFLSKLWNACVARLSSWLQDGNGLALSLTGILGLAAVLYGLYHLRLLRGPPKQDEGVSDPNQPSTSAAAAAAGPSKPAQPHLQPPGAAPSAAAAGAALHAARALGGAAAITISAPGVLLAERSPAELDEGASVLPQAAAILRELLGAAAGSGRSGGSGHNGPAVYVMAHVADDVGEAVVRGALEHEGLVGTGPGQLPPHRLLFCGTLEGKVSIVRQIEPDVHFDAHPATVRELQRFMKRLVFVGAAAEAPLASNVQCVPSFAGFFGR